MSYSVAEEEELDEVLTFFNDHFINPSAGETLSQALNLDLSSPVVQQFAHKYVAHSLPHHVTYLAR